LRLHDILPVANVRGRETQELESSAEQQVLATIVFDQSITVVAAVVLDD
jgi:hypothetical protein